MKDFKINEKIGEGAFCKVLKATGYYLKEDGQVDVEVPYALKIY